jgi:phospholipid/cholesterol/gamma-HCH transport system substrate-binding protein
MKKYSKETVVGIFVVIGLICIAYMAVNLGNVGFLGENTYSLYGKFNTVTGLREGNPVNMLGLEIGRVEKFTMDQENQQVVVEFKINKGIEIYDDVVTNTWRSIPAGEETCWKTATPSLIPTHRPTLWN